MKKPDNQKVKNTWKCTKFGLSFVVGTPKGKLYLFLKGLPPGLIQKGYSLLAHDFPRWKV